jgi:hypothetical protein
VPCRSATGALMDWFIMGFMLLISSSIDQRVGIARAGE